MLGIILLMYNLILGEFKSIDLDEGASILQEEKVKAPEDWEVASLELNKLVQDMREHGKNVVILLYL